MSEYKKVIYTAAEIDERLGRVDKFSNPNLLINPFFQINQRGQSSYSGIGYTVDGWKQRASSDVTTVNVGSVTFGKSTDIGPFIIQDVENLSALVGQQVTFSVKILAIEGVVRLRFLKTGYGNEAESGNIDSTGIFSFTHTITSETIGVAIVATTVAAKVTLESAKLEIGSVSTLANDAPPIPDFGIEECKRYLVSLREITTGGNACHAFGAAISSTEIRLTVPLSRPMRIHPTLIVNDLSKWTIRHGSVSLPITNLELLRSSSNYLLLRATTSGATAGYACYLQNADPSALILLSAEL